MEFSSPASSHSWPTATPAAEKRGTERMTEKATTPRGSSACPALLLPSLAWGEWVPRGKPCLLFLYFI